MESKFISLFSTKRLNDFFHMPARAHASAFLGNLYAATIAPLIHQKVDLSLRKCVHQFCSGAVRDVARAVHTALRVMRGVCALRARMRRDSTATKGRAPVQDRRCS
jgi:hypothetical protein